MDNLVMHQLLWPVNFLIKWKKQACCSVRVGWVCVCVRVNLVSCPLHVHLCLRVHDCIHIKSRTVPSSLTTQDVQRHFSNIYRIKLLVHQLTYSKLSSLKGFRWLFLSVVWSVSRSQKCTLEVWRVSEEGLVLFKAVTNSGCLFLMNCA